MGATEDAAAWLTRLGSLLDRRDIAAAAALFGDECYWRDVIALTWNISTVEGFGRQADLVPPWCDDFGRGRGRAATA